MQDIQLDDKKKAQLDGNIKKMLEGGANEDDIMQYASDFKNQFGQKKNPVGSQSSATQLLSQGANVLGGGILGDISKSVPKTEQKEKPRSKYDQPKVNPNRFLDIGEPVVDPNFGKNKAGLMVGQVPNSKPAFAPELAIRKGELQGRLANVLSTGKRPTNDELGQIAMIQSELQSIPQSEADAAFQKEGWNVFKTNPLLGAEFLGETVLSSLTSLFEAGKRTVPAAIGIGAAAGAPIAGIGAIGGAISGLTAGVTTGGFNLSTSGKIIQTLSDEGVDVADKDSLIAAFSDEVKMSKIRKRALKYGIPIAVLDAISGGFAGKLVAGAAGKSLAKRTLAGFGEVGMQSFAGMTGEAGGQYLADGKLNRDEILLEGIAGLVTDVPEIVSGVAMEKLKNRSSSKKTLATQVAVLGNEMGADDAKYNLNRDLANKVITPEEHKQGVAFVEKAVEINNKIPEIVIGENRATSIELIEERERLTEEVNQREEQKKGIDVAYHKVLDESNKEVQKRIDEINNQLAELAKPENNVESKTLESELRESLPYDHYERELNSEFEWVREMAKEFLADPKSFYEKRIETAKANLEADPNNDNAKDSLEYNQKELNVFNQIVEKYNKKQEAKPKEEVIVEEAIQQPIEEGSLTKSIKDLIYNKDKSVSDISNDEAEILNNLVGKENMSPEDAFRAFDGYQRNDYKIINEILRRGEKVTAETLKKVKSYVPESLLEDFGKIKSVLDNTIFSPIKKTTFYRSIFDEKADFLNDYKVGDTFTDKGISSVTIDEKFANEANKSFGEGRKSKIPIIKYEIDKGESVNGFYIGGVEKEFLINSGTKFIVTNKENVDGNLVITLKPKKETTKIKPQGEIVEEVIVEDWSKDVESIEKNLKDKIVISPDGRSNNLWGIEELVPYEEKQEIMRLFIDGDYSKSVPISRIIAEAYNKAKSDNSNPKLVKAVEDLLGKPKNKVVEEEIQQPIEYKRLVEPTKPISEMNSEELYELATKNRKALKEQDKEFFNKSEEEKEAGGYYNAIDDVEDLRDASERINFIENAENLDDLANSVKSILSKRKEGQPNEYELAILNAARRKSVELGVEPKDLIKSIASKVANEYEDSSDAELMVANVLEKLMPKQEQNIQPPIEEQGGRVKVFRGIGRNMGEGENEGFNWVSSDKGYAEQFSNEGNILEEEIDKPKNTFKFPWSRPSQPITGKQLVSIIDKAIFKAAKDKSLTLSEWKLIEEKKNQLSKILDVDDKTDSFQSKVNDPKVSKIISEILSDLGYDAIEINDEGVTNYGIIKSKNKPIEEQPQGEVVEAVRVEQEPEAKPQKVFAEKDLDRAKAKKVHQRVREMEAPSDAAQIALRYIADGGKVSEAAINEVAGTVKRARLNTGAKDLKSNEAKSRDYYQKDGETLDELAHRLWENSSQEVSEIDIKDALMSVIGDYNTRLEAGTAYLEQYNAEYIQEKYYERLAEEREEEWKKEQDELERQLRTDVDEQIEGEASEEHINNLIKQYESEFKAENQQPKPASKADANKEIGGRASGKEDGSEKGKVGEQPIGEAEAKNVDNNPKEIIKKLKERKSDKAIHAEIFQKNGYNVFIYDNNKVLIDKTFKTHEEAKKYLNDWASQNGKENQLKYEYGTITDIAKLPYRQEITGNIPKDFIEQNKIKKESIAEAKPKQEDVEDSDVFYHSTNKEFEGFDDEKIGTNKDFGWFGLGHYFTSNKEESKYYGKNVIEINISKIKDKIYKVVLENQSIKIPKSVFDYIQKNLKNFKDYELGTYDNFKVDNLIDKEGSRVFSDAFKNQGYLGVRVSGDANELVIFESKNIPRPETKTPLEEKYEQINKLRGEKVKELAKQKLISDNFDSIVSQLMTKNKIKRKC